MLLGDARGNVKSRGTKQLEAFVQGLNGLLPRNQVGKKFTKCKDIMTHKGFRSRKRLNGEGHYTSMFINFTVIQDS